MSDNENITGGEPAALSDDKLEQAFEQLEKKTQPTKPRANSAGSILAVLLSLVAIGIASYPAIEMYMQTQDGAQSPGDMVTAVRENAIALRAAEATQARISGQIESIELKLRQAAELSSSIDDDRLGAEELKAYVVGELTRMNDRLGTGSQDWLFAEVEYLVRMANQRVLMENDAQSAIRLLETADQIVRDTEGLTAHPLRQALVKDIAALKAINAPDLQGHYLRLSTLIEQVPQLKQLVPVYSPVYVKAAQSESDSLLQRFLLIGPKIFQRLSHLVDFRRGEVEIKPILPPEQDYYLRQNLILKFHIAQLALLEGNGTVFRTSLAETQRWISASFDKVDALTVAMLSTVSELSEVNVELQFPDISDSQRAARDLLVNFSQGAAR